MGSSQGCVRESVHAGESLQACYDGCKIAFNLGNKISKLILAQIIACLNAPLRALDQGLGLRAGAGVSSQGWAVYFPASRP